MKIGVMAAFLFQNFEKYFFLSNYYIQFLLIFFKNVQGFEKFSEYCQKNIQKLKVMRGLCCKNEIKNQKKQKV